MLLRYSVSGVRDIEIQKTVLLQIISELDAALLRKLHRIIYQIHNHLHQTAPVSMYDAFSHLHMIPNADTGLFISQPDGIFELYKQAVHIYIGVYKIQRSRLDLRKVEHIADKLKQEHIVVLNDMDILLPLFRKFPFLRCQQVGEADNGVERSPDFVAYIGKKGRFERIRFLSLHFGLDECFLHFFSLSDCQGRTDETQRPAVLVPFVYRCPNFHPLIMGSITLSGGDPIFLLHFMHFAIDEPFAGKQHPLSVRFVDFGEIDGSGNHQLIAVGHSLFFHYI